MCLICLYLAMKHFFSGHVTKGEEVKCEVEGLPQTLLALAEIHPQAPPPSTSEQLDIPRSPKSGHLGIARDRSAGVSHE